MRHIELEKTNFIKHFTAYTTKSPFFYPNNQKGFDKESIEEINQIEDVDGKIEKIIEIISKTTNQYKPLNTDEDTERYLNQTVIAFNKLFKTIKQSIQYTNLEGLEIHKLIDFDVDDMGRLISSIISSKEALLKYSDERKNNISNFNEIIDQMDSAIALTQPVQAKKTIPFLKNNIPFQETIYFSNLDKRLPEVLSEIYPLLKKDNFKATDYYINAYYRELDTFNIYFMNDKQVQLNLKVEFNKSNHDQEDSFNDDNYYTKLSIKYDIDDNEPLNYLKKLGEQNNSHYVYKGNPYDKSREIMVSNDVHSTFNHYQSDEHKAREAFKYSEPGSAAEMRDKHLKTEYDFYQNISHENDLKYFESLARNLKREYLNIDEIIENYLSKTKTQTNNQENTVNKPKQ